MCCANISRTNLTETSIDPKLLTLLENYPAARPLKIAIAGASGLVGNALCAFLEFGGHQVWRLSRAEHGAGERTIKWNPKTQSIEAEKLEGFDALISLSGRNIANQRWNAEVKKEILESRVSSTQLLVETLRSLQSKPRVFVCASATGYYGDRGSEVLTEQSLAGTGFLSDVVAKWEAEIFKAESIGVRTAAFRMGMVIAREGGALAKMYLPFNLGLGGVVGSGTQYMSWISIDDVIGAFYFALVDEHIRGAYNLVAPEAITNAEFTKAMGSALHRPTFVPVPAFVVRTIFGELADPLVLASQRVVPEKLVKSGYGFLYPGIREALEREVRKK